MLEQYIEHIPSNQIDHSLLDRSFYKLDFQNNQKIRNTYFKTLINSEQTDLLTEAIYSENINRDFFDKNFGGEIPNAILSNPKVLGIVLESKLISKIDDPKYKKKLLTHILKDPEYITSTQWPNQVERTPEVLTMLAAYNVTANSFPANFGHKLLLLASNVRIAEALLKESPQLKPLLNKINPATGLKPFEHFLSKSTEDVPAGYYVRDLEIITEEENWNLATFYFDQLDDNEQINKNDALGNSVLYRLIARSKKRKEKAKKYLKDSIDDSKKHKEYLAEHKMIPKAYETERLNLFQEQYDAFDQEYDHSLLKRAGSIINAWGANIDGQDALGRSILSRFVDGNAPYIIEFILRNNPTLNLEDNDGNNPFHHFFMAQKENMNKEVFDKMVFRYFPQPGTRQKNKKSVTPLQLAIKHYLEHFDSYFMETLLEREGINFTKGDQTLCAYTKDTWGSNNNKKVSQIDGNKYTKLLERLCGTAIGPMVKSFINIDKSTIAAECPRPPLLGEHKNVTCPTDISNLGRSVPVPSKEATPSKIKKKAIIIK